MSVSIGLIRAKMLKQSQDTKYYTQINSIESSLYGHINEGVYCHYITISITASASIQSSTTPSGLLNNQYFIYDNSGYYLYQWVNSSPVLITNKDHCAINDILYSVNNNGLMTPINNSRCIYFEDANYVLIRTHCSGSISFYCENTLDPPYCKYPYLLHVCEFDNTIVYPTDMHNNTLLTYNNNIINVKSLGKVSVNKNNFITCHNYYIDGTTPSTNPIPPYQTDDSNLVPGGTFTCFDGIYIRNVTNNGWYHVTYSC